MNFFLISKFLIFTLERPDEEMFDLWKFSQSPKYKNILDHPVIDIFVNLKWNRLKTIYYIDARITLFNAVMLTWYIFIMLSGNSKRGISKSNQDDFCDTKYYNVTTSFENIKIGYGMFCFLYICLCFSILGSFIESKVQWCNEIFLTWKDLMILILGAMVLASPHWNFGGFKL